MQTSRCSCCRKDLPFKDFPKCKNSIRGIYWYCRACVSTKEKVRYELHKMERRERNRFLRKNLSEESKQKAREYEKSYAKKRAIAEKKRRAANPHIFQCRQQTKNAIKSGQLLQQLCSVCGSNKAETHHDDYSKPLKVVWLCRQHHVDLHRKQREESEVPDDR